MRSFTLSFALLVACGHSSTATPEVVSHDALATAVVRDGDVIYLASPLRLQRLDVESGAVVEVAGPEWAQCPKDSSISWMAMPTDFIYPAVTIHGNTARLADSYCGMWTFDLATKTSRMLVDSTAEARAAVYQTTGAWPNGAAWNGKDGPDWQYTYGMSLADDGDGFLACFPTAKHLELWRVSADGDPLESIATFDHGHYCRQIQNEGASILLSTDTGIHRVDRASHAISAVTSVDEYGTLHVTSNDGALYFTRENAIVKWTSSGETVLRATNHDPREVVRIVGAVDAGYLYFHEGHSLMRVPVGGGEASDVVAGTDDHWVMPGVLAFGRDHLYFERLPHDTKQAGTLERLEK